MKEGLQEYQKRLMELQSESQSESESKLKKNKKRKSTSSSSSSTQVVVDEDSNESTKEKFHSLDDEDWRNIAETESVMELVKFLSDFAQYEQYHSAAFYPILVNNIWNSLHEGVFPVLQRVGNEMVRIKKSVEEFSDVSKIVVKRAIAEFHRRYSFAKHFKNKNNDIPKELNFKKYQTLK